MLIDRALAAQLARETVAILDAGHYTAPSSRRVDLTAAIAECVRHTVEYPPDRDVRLPSMGLHETRISAVNDTVLEVGRHMARNGPVAALNFASAESPGGGFLNGARAQEEAIARSSALYAALRGRRMYKYHRERLDPMYSDYVIYSPDVPVFRTDAGDLLDEPWTMSIVTSPAVHSDGVREYVPEREPDIPAVMTARTAKVLAVTASHGVTRFILGAWGCGAFGGDPQTMAEIFRDALDGPFSGVFDEIAFAITDWSSEQKFIGPFKQVFGG
jgi:uncharacterized protein (TIGR02452 family)